MSAALEPFARALVRAFEPLLAAFDDPRRFGLLIRNLGWEADVSQLILSDGKVGQIAQDLRALIKEGRELLVKLDAGASQLEVVVALLDVALQLIPLAGHLGSLKASDLNHLPVDFRDPKFWAELALDLPEYLLTRYLTIYEPAWAALLQLLGLMKVTLVASDAAQGGLVRAAFWRRELVWDSLTGLLRDPGGHLRAHYHWGDPADELSHVALLQNLARLLLALGVRARLQPIRAAIVADHYGGTPAEGVCELDVPLLDGMFAGGFGELGLLVIPRPSTKGAGIDGLLLANLSYGDVAGSVDLGRGFSLRASASVEASASFGVAIFPSGPQLVGAIPDGRMALDIVGAPAKPWRLFGAADGARLELSGLRVGVAFEGSNRPDARFTAALIGPNNKPGLVVIVSAAEGDGFLREVLGDVEIRAELGPEMTWSSRDGLLFAGGLALEATIPVGRTWGPLTIDAVWLHLGAHLGQDAGALVAGAVSASFELGPFKASVERIGVGLALTPAGDKNGAFGALDPRPEFIPPLGLGLGLDADVVRGGGYLYYDHGKGEYAGVLQLAFAEIAIVAIGILTTKMPDGSPGWSLYLGITCELPNVQLGFGFTLNGVGGLIAINRTVDSDAIRRALREGGLDSVLFPEDPIANAPAILRNIGAFFPIQRRTVVFGPMIKIGWGTPTLIEGDLGVILVVPEWRLLLLGSLSCNLPTPEAPLIRLNLDVLGEIDFPGGTIAVDASLYDSSIVGICLTGDMAFRANFVEDPGFLMAVGGFHPDFELPACWSSLKSMRRLAASLAIGDNVHLSLQSYLAITSNTLQFGAAANLTATALGFTVEGGMHMDVLIVFKPFGFCADIGAHVALRRGNWDIFAIYLDLVLKGPRPWYARGTASFRVLGTDWSFGFEVRSGDGLEQEALAPVDVLAQVLAALRQPGNWAEAPGSARVPGLHTGAPEPVDAAAEACVWVRPDARVEVRQKVAPLSTDPARPIVLERFGHHSVLGSAAFIVDAATLSGVDAVGVAVDDWFAATTFFTYSDEERLSAPSFERMPCGLAFGDDELELPPESQQRAVELVHEEQAWDTLGRDAGSGRPRVPQRLPAAAIALALQRARATVGEPQVQRVRRASGLTAQRFVLIREGDAQPVVAATAYHVVRAARRADARPDASALRIVPAVKEKP